MKTIKLFTAVLMMLALPMMSFAAHADSINPSEISKKIQSEIDFPETLVQTQSDSRVLVVFSIDGTGAVKVHEVGTDNPELKSSIVSQFEEMNFNPAQYEVNGLYSIRLNFKTL